jgi:mRNA-degrading endonuclease RelE of RelBE toxin-antitoxin system
MKKFKYNSTHDFDDDYKKLRKNHDLINRVKKKMHKIRENPFHYKPLRNVLKNKRRTHIGSFVLTFEIDEINNIITFQSLKHHDRSYK